MARRLTRYRLAMLFYGGIAPVALVGYAALISDSASSFHGLLLAAGVISIAGLGFIITSRSDVRTLWTAVQVPDPHDEPPAALREAVSLAGLALVSWGGLVLSTIA